jgi:hypothetical protein
MSGKTAKPKAKPQNLKTANLDDPVSVRCDRRNWNYYASTKSQTP